MPGEKMCTWLLAFRFLYPIILRTEMQMGKNRSSGDWSSRVEWLEAFNWNIFYQSGIAVAVEWISFDLTPSQ